MRFIKSLAANCLVLCLPLASFAAGADSRVADAVKSQDKNTVMALLKAHVDVNAPQADGATALHWAAHWNDSEMADLLIRAQANVNAADELGTTPLSLACTNGSVSMVDKLLKAGANVNSVTSTGESALMTCAHAGSVGGVQALLAHGANVNEKEHLQDQTALMWAVAQRHPDVVQVLLEHGADVKARSRISHLLIMRDDLILQLPLCPPKGSAEKNNSGINAKAEVVHGILLTATCADAETIEKGGSTALLFAARIGDLESAKLLVAAGANVNDVASDRNNALVVAAFSGQGKLAAFLLDKGADANWAGAGYTALHAAVLRNDAELVKALLAHGANPNSQLTKGTPVTRDGQDFELPSGLAGATPFFLAAKLVEVDIMKALAAKGANASLALADGTTPLMAAAGLGWRNGTLRRGSAAPAATAPPPDDDQALEAIKLTLQMGADATTANRTGDTALHGAASSGYTEVIRLLADKGADINAKNGIGETPLALATVSLERGKGRHELKSTAALLRNLGARDESAASSPAASTPGQASVKAPASPSNN
jgi:ankyrin